jgi:hypothetical protein
MRTEPKGHATATGPVCVAPVGTNTNPRCNKPIPADRIQTADRHGREPLYCSETCAKRQYNLSYVIAQAKKLGLK